MRMEWEGVPIVVVPGVAGGALDMLVVEMPIVVVAPAGRWTGLAVGEHGVWVLDPSWALPQVCCLLEAAALVILPNAGYWVESEQLDRQLF
jgi:hypothetical protein